MIFAEVPVPGELEHAEALVTVVAATKRGEQLRKIVKIGRIVEIRHHLHHPGRGIGRRPWITGVGAGDSALPVGNRDVSAVRIGSLAARAVGVHPQRQPHAAVGEPGQRVVDHAEVVLAVVRSIRGRVRGSVGCSCRQETRKLAS